MSLLGDSIRWALPDLRAAARSTMTATAKVEELGEAVFNPDTGLVEPPRTTVIAAAPARLRQPTSDEVVALFGEEAVNKIRFAVDMPHTVTGVKVDHVITFTEAADPDMLVYEFRVVLVSMRDHLVQRSYGCVVVE